MNKIINALVPIDAIKPHPRNYRSHPEQQLTYLQASHERFGQYRSVVLWSRPRGKYVTVAGHGIIEAMRQRGITEIRADVLPQNTPQTEIDAILIADNNIAQHASDDDALLAQLLQEQQNAGFDLTALGSDDETLRQMLASLGDGYAGEEESDGAEDELPEEVETRCKPGDIWTCGSHVVACLDALDTVTYPKLLAGVRPHAIITDPPYGMRLDTDYRAMHTSPTDNYLRFMQTTGANLGHNHPPVLGDDSDFDASWLREQFADVKEQFWFGADYYAMSLGDTGHMGCWLVWDKRLTEEMDRGYGSCFELIWSKQKHKRDILRHVWSGIFGMQYETSSHKRVHPTQKPVRLLEDIITRYTDEGQIILDPFLGSGSTLISAQRTGRVVYGCELSPAYCDVILSRYEAETGQFATLLSRHEEAVHA